MAQNSDPYMSVHWSEEHQAHYRTRWNGQAWVFWDYIGRRDSLDAHQFTNSLVVQGHPIEGTYNSQNPQSQQSEPLHPSYYVRDGRYFQPGRVFSMLFTEAAGTTVTDYNTTHSAISQVAYGEPVYTQIRRFIVVRHKREFCYAVPIFTYGGRGTTKPGVVAKEHAIAYSYGSQARLLTNEAPLEKNSICVVMNPSERPLHIASRIYFSIHHPIQYNVKVRDLGYVHPSQMQDFQGYWHMENRADTSQDPDITAGAV
ncbi:hypothetical protein P153DRAFT_329412 [Dothidotthia symphoricarpi CBS 119687]|uniref:DUF6590 domain-containing protein n=1 Tax=Dothidotthia symphoricarpi CBS 119687 TaxID=1392245 RepID=A0A6A6AT48_9PLEO|nr:uncharacterized protein P153DRAFT_329412 [Dothidotthia symphoricarpi CBS 119687]KAF2134756.1 hypothetical protein P153DRAFT_329412 [Dothidotthia symphoricarpi CBS 119687]